MCQNKGFTLIEVLFAVVILMVGLLGLLHTVTVAVENGVANSLREEAVNIAGQRMNGGLVDTADVFHEGLRNMAFDNLATDPDVNPGVSPKPQVCPGFAVKRDFKSFATNYCVKATVGGVINGDARSVLVEVRWQHRGTDYSHSITSVVSRGTGV